MTNTGSNPVPQITFVKRKELNAMFTKLIAVVDVTKPIDIEPIEPPKPILPKRVAVESRAHKEWVEKKNEFINRHTQGREPEGDVLKIMIASIGEEPPFE